MATKIHGASDDNVCFGGDIHGEVGCYGTDDAEQGVLLMCSDGSILEAKYGKLDSAIWGIQLHKKGTLFKEIVPCDDPDADIYSDVAHFDDGLKWVYAAKEWERVK